MDYKSINLEFKADEADEASFTAYASVFGSVDEVNDIVVAGAFAKSLETDRSVKCLFNHDPNQVIGIFDEIREDDKGLFVKGRFADTHKGQEVRTLVKMGAINSLSIGYRTKDYEWASTGERILKEVALYEISFVSFPANTSANVISAKSIDDGLTELLRERLSLLGAF